MLILTDIEALDTKDNFKFSTEELKGDKYHYIINQGTIGEISNDTLIKDLEITPRKNIEDFLNTYVNADCFFKDDDGKKEKIEM